MIRDYRNWMTIGRDRITTAFTQNHVRIQERRHFRKRQPLE